MFDLQELEAKIIILHFFMDISCDIMKFAQDLPHYWWFSIHLLLHSFSFYFFICSIFRTQSKPISYFNLLMEIVGALISINWLANNIKLVKRRWWRRRRREKISKTKTKLKLWKKVKSRNTFKYIGVHYSIIIIKIIFMKRCKFKSIEDLWIMD